MRVRNFKGHTKKKLSESFSKIVEAHVEEAKKGSLKHTEWLFEIVGVKEETKANNKAKNGDPSFASLLIEELERQKGAAKNNSEGDK